jgi:hypothetical protein
MKKKLPRPSKKNEIMGYPERGIPPMAMSEKSLRKDSPWDPPPVPVTATKAKPMLPRKSGPPPIPPAAGAPKAAPPKASSSTPMLFAGKYPMADASHHDELHTNAAINMLQGGMPKEQAEKKAHDDYVTKLRTDAVHYHAAGMKAATAIGDTDSAKKHAGMMQLHRKALGTNPIGAPPKPMAGMATAPKMKFKPHPGDHFAVNDVVSSAPHPDMPKI